MSNNSPEAPQAEFVLFQAANGSTHVACRFESDTLRFTQAAMADLYQISPQVITQHGKAVYQQGAANQQLTLSVLLTPCYARLSTGSLYSCCCFTVLWLLFCPKYPLLFRTH